MDFALFFPACLLFWIRVVASHVAPPENVTLDCRNFRNMLKWSYPENTPGLKFKVNIGSYQNSHLVSLVETKALHADVSFLNDPSDGYFLTVTAVVGGNRSVDAPSDDGITFSYYQDNDVQQKCSLDLSPVNVTLQRDNKVQISFVHPFLFHRQHLNSSTKKSQKKINQAEIPAVNFKVTILNQTGKPHSFTCEDRVCNEVLPVDAAQQNHCLNITGETLMGPLVKPTQLYCAFKEPSASNFTIVYIVSAVLAVATTCLIVFMAYQKMTKPSVSLSNFLVINKSPMSSPMAPPEPVSLNNVECEAVPSSPTPLLSQTEEEDKTEFTSSCNSDGYDKRFPIGVSSKNGDVSNVTLEGQVNEEGPGYMAGNLDEDDETSSANESTSGYEKRGTVLVDLGQDEMAKGYRG
ncbi:growth/differentiation factor 10b [Archocentrus centrarchus]|uniref:growth/differentiation factor 10b n=1 Tax=Archocentrus centrarchus TaxID=63155 RepID=UPI0011E9D38A|nr:interferon gamma receptor 1-like [Archocentrus centrarchus]